jgi:integrase
MTSNEFAHHKRGHGSGVRHSKQDSLDEREFELLVEGTRELKGYRQTEAEFIVFVLGRLGLRRGEITHLKREWIDRREKLIKIPGHQPCTKGQNGGMCGHCRQLVKQAADINEIPVSEIKGNWWRPKTESAVRGIPYDWSPRAEIAIDRFCEHFDSFTRSSTAVSRRIKAAAEHAPQLDKDDIYPHALRATAATYQVSRGLGVHALTSMMGWANLSTAQVYISNSDENTRRAVRAAHNQ